MKRAEAQQAIDEAFADGLKNLFLRLVMNLREQPPENAVKEFTTGIGFHDDAHTKASAVVEQIFAE